MNRVLKGISNISINSNINEERLNIDNSFSDYIKTIRAQLEKEVETFKKKE